MQLIIDNICMEQKFGLVVAVSATVGLIYIGASQKQRQRPARQAPRQAMAVIAPTQGNEADEHGVARLDRTYSGFSLGRRTSIMGRGVVIHALPDNGGQPTGNAGARIGCGVIGIAESE